ncbi:MAG: pimeloyl-ACP methyl ester carboxylesterase, partial [Saprospiraceae bacterium]
MSHALAENFTTVENVKIHYTIAGEGEAILFLHGWPTSSYLWRNVVPELSQNYQVIAIDLPGYGKSSKDIADSYSFRYYERIIEGFLENLGIQKISLGVHDAGGPIGLYWAIHNMEKVDRLILLNTLLYPKFSFAVKLFVFATAMPGLKRLLTSPYGIKSSMIFGVYQKDKLSKTAIQYYQDIVADDNSRKLLSKVIQRLGLSGYHEIAEKISQFKVPVLIIYGEEDKILPQVAKTMNRVKEDLPQSEIH